jgi:hypothetical protein
VSYFDLINLFVHLDCIKVIIAFTKMMYPYQQAIIDSNSNSKRKKDDGCNVSKIVYVDST